MNANEVIAHSPAGASAPPVHPNDHVNMGQSSNDAIPTAIHVSAALLLREQLLPALAAPGATCSAKESGARGHRQDRPHAPDGCDAGDAWRRSSRAGARRSSTASRGCAAVEPRLLRAGAGRHRGGHRHQRAPAVRGGASAASCSASPVSPFEPSRNYFEALSAQDTAVELSGQLKVIAVSLMKIANDLRWMNSGPLAGLGEIALPALQPGSSIMPGKVNPVIPEATAMVAAQVIGNDAAITIAGQSGNFQLNVMLPVIAYNLLESIDLLANVSRALADRAIRGFTVNQRAPGRSPRSQSDPGDRAQSGDRLREGRRDRQEGLRRGQADPRGRAGDDRPAARGARPAARSGRAHHAVASRAAAAAGVSALQARRMRDATFPATDWAQVIRARLAGSEPHHEISRLAGTGPERRGQPEIPPVLPACTQARRGARARWCSAPSSRCSSPSAPRSCATTPVRSASRAGASRRTMRARGRPHCARRTRRSDSRSASSAGRLPAGPHGA